MIFKKSYFNPLIEVTLDDSICLEASVRPVCSRGLGVPPREPSLQWCSLYSQTHRSNSGCYCVSPASTLSARWDLGCPGHPVSDSEVLRFGGGGGKGMGRALVNADLRASGLKSTDPRGKQVLGKPGAGQGPKAPFPLIPLPRIPASPHL